MSMPTETQEPQQQVLAHIIFPGTKLHEIEQGMKQRVSAMCGAWVTGRSQPDAPVCRRCFVTWRDRSEPAGTQEGT